MRALDGASLKPLISVPVYYRCRKIPPIFLAAHTSSAMWRWTKPLYLCYSFSTTVPAFTTTAFRLHQSLFLSRSNLLLPSDHRHSHRQIRLSSSVTMVRRVILSSSNLALFIVRAHKHNHTSCSFACFHDDRVLILFPTARRHLCASRQGNASFHQIVSWSLL
jgi:uncharacterized membrane protein